MSGFTSKSFVLSMISVRHAPECTRRFWLGIRTWLEARSSAGFEDAGAREEQGRSEEGGGGQQPSGPGTGPAQRRMGTPIPPHMLLCKLRLREAPYQT